MLTHGRAEDVSTWNLDEIAPVLDKIVLSEHEERSAPTARYAWRSCGTLRTLDEYIGQAQLRGAEHHHWPWQTAMLRIALRRSIEADCMFLSIPLWGPPGSTLPQEPAKPPWYSDAKHRRSSPIPPSNRTLVASHFETLSAVIGMNTCMAKPTCEACTHACD